MRVIRARLVGDAQIGAEERGPEFGDQLLHRIGLVAEALAELPIAARLMAEVQCTLCRYRHNCHYAAFRIMPRRGVFLRTGEQHQRGMTA